MSGKIHNFFHNIELSALLTVIGVVFLFSFSIVIVLIAPGYIDKSWVEPTSSYQVQIYEEYDPNFYISSSPKAQQEMQYVYHIKQNHTLLAFSESPTVRIIAPFDLQKYITHSDDEKLKLTSRLLLIRPVSSAHSQPSFDPQTEAALLKQKLLAEWKQTTSEKYGSTDKQIPPDFLFYELYDPALNEAFALAPDDSFLENWVDENFIVIDPKKPFHNDHGVIYINNPIEYRISIENDGHNELWGYDSNGSPIASLDDLKAASLGFKSRQDLIALGEHIYAIEGCWYCHTDQTRTLVQDVVLNGSDSYPAPPSSANEYIYQQTTFPGTHRIGPDISRVGIKKPSRDWHKAHFWAPKTASPGSIMPAFQHFFDYDPRGTSKIPTGVPNWRFEAIFQYLMTKGTRITAPTQAWWLGKDPVNTIGIIEGRRVFKTGDNQ